MSTYPLARPGVFRTIQGEGALLGESSVFVRLAGCSVGCPQCDTDYRVHERATAAEIRARIEAVCAGARWIWVTGGEPADHNLWPLLEEMRLCGKAAVATSGHKALAGWLVDFLSVSPHGTPDRLVLRSGSQLNLVPTLNGLRLDDWLDFDASGFAHRWVTPPWYAPAGRMEMVDECRRFLDRRPDFKLGIQAHKFWGLP